MSDISNLLVYGTKISIRQNNDIFRNAGYLDTYVVYKVTLKYLSKEFGCDLDEDDLFISSKEFAEIIHPENDYNINYLFSVFLYLKQEVDLNAKELRDKINEFVYFDVDNYAKSVKKNIESILG